SGRFETNVSMARHRVFENSFEGELLGRKLRTDDPTTLTSNYISQMTRAIANRDFEQNVLKTGIRASDGRPIAALSGSGKVVYDKAGKPTMLLNPESLQNIHIPDAEVDRMKKSGVLDRFLQNESIIKSTHEGEDSYVWNTHGYREIDTNALHGWK